MREPIEIEKHPDRAIDGATWRHPPEAGVSNEDIKTIRTADDTHDAMVRNYRSYVCDPARRAGFASLFSHLASDPGPQLFHCAAGKDRTGWAAALVHHIAEADRSTILKDYLLTNQYAIKSRKATLDAVLEHLGADTVPAFEPAFLCHHEYLDAALDEADHRYGSLDGYLGDGLGLPDDAIVELRSRLVVSD